MLGDFKPSSFAIAEWVLGMVLVAGSIAPVPDSIDESVSTGSTGSAGF